LTTATDLTTFKKLSNLQRFIPRFDNFQKVVKSYPRFIPRFDNFQKVVKSFPIYPRFIPDLSPDLTTFKKLSNLPRFIPDLSPIYPRPQFLPALSKISSVVKSTGLILVILHSPDLLIHPHFHLVKVISKRRFEVLGWRWWVLGRCVGDGQ